MSESEVDTIMCKLRSIQSAFVEQALTFQKRIEELEKKVKKLEEK